MNGGSSQGHVEAMPTPELVLVGCGGLSHEWVGFPSFYVGGGFSFEGCMKEFASSLLYIIYVY